MSNSLLGHYRVGSKELGNASTVHAFI